MQSVPTVPTRAAEGCWCWLHDWHKRFGNRICALQIAGFLYTITVLGSFGDYSTGKETKDVKLNQEPHCGEHRSPSPMQNKVTLQIKPTQPPFTLCLVTLSPSADWHRSGVIGRKKEEQAVNQQGMSSKPGGGMSSSAFNFKIEAENLKEHFVRYGLSFTFINRVWRSVDTMWKVSVLTSDSTSFSLTKNWNNRTKCQEIKY